MDKLVHGTLRQSSQEFFKRILEQMVEANLDLTNAISDSDLVLALVGQEHMDVWKNRSLVFVREYDDQGRDSGSGFKWLLGIQVVQTGVHQLELRL
jgi:hypothetical protein